MKVILKPKFRVTILGGVLAVAAVAEPVVVERVQTTTTAVQNAPAPDAET